MLMQLKSTWSTWLAKQGLYSKKRRSPWLTKLIASGDRLAFDWKAREMMYRHLSAQIANDVPVEIALETFAAQLKRKKRKSAEKVVKSVARGMQDGASLVDALCKWIPDDEAGMIAGGELSGNLPAALDLIIESKRRILRVRKAYKMSLIRPAIYVLAVYAVLWAIGVYVTPSLMLVLPASKATGLVYLLYAASDFALSWQVVIPPLLLLAIALTVAYALPRWQGRKRIAAEKYFPFSFYRDIHGYMWLMSFAALLRAGLPDVEILKRQMMNATPWLKERLREIRIRMIDGATLPSALLAKGKKRMPAFGFPNPDVIDNIQSMAGFKDFPERISKLAMQWAEEIEEASVARAAIFGFVMEILMYVLMGILMMAINSMSTQISSAVGM